MGMVLPLVLDLSEGRLLEVADPLAVGEAVAVAPSCVEELSSGMELAGEPDTVAERLGPCDDVLVASVTLEEVGDAELEIMARTPVCCCGSGFMRRRG